MTHAGRPLEWTFDPLEALATYRFNKSKAMHQAPFVAWPVKIR